MSGTTANVFPKNECEALALLYVQKQELYDVTPSELYKMYKFAYQEIAEQKRIDIQEHAKLGNDL